MRFAVAVVVALVASSVCSAFKTVWKQDFDYSFPAAFGVSLPSTDNTIHVYSEYGAVSALDAATGATKWQTNYTGGYTILFAQLSGLTKQFLVLASNPVVGSYGALTVLSLADGSLVWNSTSTFPLWTILPVVSDEVLLVCASNAGCSGLDVYSGGTLYSTIAPTGSVLPCGDGSRAIVIGAPTNNVVQYGFVDVKTGSPYWMRTTQDTSVAFSVCAERSAIRIGMTGTYVVDLATANPRFTVPAGTYAINEGMVCGTYATPMGTPNAACLDEFQAYAIMNQSLPLNTASTGVVSVFEGQMQITTTFAFNGVGPAYLNVSGLDLNTGATLYSFVAPYNSVIGANGVPAYVTGPNGAMVVPFLGGLTGWSRQGKFLTRSCTVSGISQIVGSKNAVFVAYQNSVAAYTL